MRILSAADIQAALDDIPSAVERLRAATRRAVGEPHPLRAAIPDMLGVTAGHLSVAAAWQTGRHIGIRIETAFPDNSDRNLPERISMYLVLDGRSGRPIALLDGPSLTRNRVTATIALASSYLTRGDCARLLLIGAGPIAIAAAVAHAAVRPIKEVLVWSRNPKTAARLARRLKLPGARIEATTELQTAVRGADIVSAATPAPDPILLGEWLMPGVHVDLIGAVRPDTREADDEVLARGRLFVDDRAAALEIGEISDPIQRSIITPDDIAADLTDLVRGERAGRRFHRQITVFKAAGSGAQDLAMAQLVVERA